MSYLWSLHDGLISQHGMGVPSVTILLHEILKLLHYAGAKDPLLFRIGTCGGLGEQAAVLQCHSASVYIDQIISYIIII